MILSQSDSPYWSAKQSLMMRLLEFETALTRWSESAMKKWIDCLTQSEFSIEYPIASDSDSECQIGSRLLIEMLSEKGWMTYFDSQNRIRYQSASWFGFSSEIEFQCASETGFLFHFG